MMKGYEELSSQDKLVLDNFVNLFDSKGGNQKANEIICKKCNKIHRRKIRLAAIFIMAA